MQVSFRECDWFDLWIWIELADVPSEREKQLLDEVLASWFLIGKLGGFNATNLQVQESGADISHLDYDNDMAEAELMSVMHNMGEVEYDMLWARCWFDLGTSDAIALDGLLNVLRQFSVDYVPLKRVVIGGTEIPDGSTVA